MADEEKKAQEMIQFVIFKIGEEEFAAPIKQIREIIRLPHITTMPKAPSFIEGVINLRGQVIAVVDLAKRFELAPKEKDDKNRIIVVEMGDDLIGMIVDSVTEVLRISQEDIDMTPSLIESKIEADFIEGLGKQDGRLFILLDLDKILTVEEVDQLEAVEG